MSTDVGTTPRKALTRTQRLALFESFKGICQLCKKQIIGPNWRDEHMRALGLGGTNKWDNRAPVHIECALVKDGDDKKRIAHAKRQKMAALGIKDEKRKKLQSRGFDKIEKRPRELTKKSLPPRDVFTGEVYK